MTTMQLLEEQDLYREELISFLNETESAYITEEMIEEMEREFYRDELEREFYIVTLRDEERDCPYFQTGLTEELLRGGEWE